MGDEEESDSLGTVEERDYDVLSAVGLDRLRAKLGTRAPFPPDVRAIFELWRASRASSAPVPRLTRSRPPVSQTPATTRRERTACAR